MRYPSFFRAFLLLALLLIGAWAQAQTAAIGQEGAAGVSNLRDLAMGAPAVLPHGSGEGTVGSPYADARWLPAQLRLTNNLPLAPIPLKYDVLDRRLLMRSSARATDSLQLDDARVASFVLMEPASGLGPARPRQFRRFAEAPLARERPDYVEVLHAGRYTLLKHYAKTLRTASQPGAYSTSPTPDVIEDHPAYYLRTPEAALLPVKLTLKALQAAAPALAGPLKTAARAPKTEADWVAVLHAVDPEPAK
ncbi:hypothetical protein [Hymenobacter antarcticus]|uniref:Uncharacterized protein n=1 Tax=Hymenobacter antarcticus TaxID=486270 RepID=A0ABP7PVH5_9BACT